MRGLRDALIQTYWGREGTCCLVQSTDQSWAPEPSFQAARCLPQAVLHTHTVPQGSVLTVRGSALRPSNILQYLLKHQTLNVHVIFSVVAFYFIFGKKQYSNPLLTPSSLTKLCNLRKCQRG